jgi:hypothetical protein
MASAATDSAVRNYLLALKDPGALRDQGQIAELEQRLAETEDPMERLSIRQQLRDAETPAIDHFEDAFVEHAKAWADDHGISGEAFIAEGVPAPVLRRAGFPGLAAGRGRGGRRRPSRGGGTRQRVNADEVRAAIPKGTFTLRQLQESTGASYGVVRRVVEEQINAGKVKEVGPAPEHIGRGRVPTLYKR